MKSKFLKVSSAVESHFGGNFDLLAEMVMLEHVLIYAQIASVIVCVTDIEVKSRPLLPNRTEFKYISGYHPVPRSFAKLVITTGSASVPFFWLRDHSACPPSGCLMPAFHDSPPPQSFDRKGWLHSRGGLTAWPLTLDSAYLSRRGLEKAISAAYPEVEAESKGGGWPWGSFETGLLRHLAAAAERFWKNYDPAEPDTAPLKKDIVGWLIKRGVAQRSAEQIDTILRAEGIPKGPRRTA